MKKNGNIRCEASHDPDETSFIDEQKMEHNIEKLSQMVQVVGSDQSNKNLSKAAINVGAEMFVTLNSCLNSYYLKLYWNVIYGPESRIALPLIALKIVKKANINFKKDALKIFSKISSVMGFQHISFLGENIADIEGRYKIRYVFLTVLRRVES